MTKTDELAMGFIRRLGAPINTSAAIIISIYTLLWGFWLANPFWTLLDKASLYTVMANSMPEGVWGLIAIIVGAMMTYGVKRNSYRSLTTGAFSGAVFWFTVSIAYFMGDWQSTGGLTALMVTLYCSFIYLNLRLNKDFLH